MENRKSSVVFYSRFYIAQDFELLKESIYFP